jgi:hypothetical protein
MWVDQRPLVLDDFVTVQQVSFRYGTLRQRPRVCSTQRSRSKSTGPDGALYAIGRLLGTRLKSRDVRFQEGDSGSCDRRLATVPEGTDISRHEITLHLLKIQLTCDDRNRLLGVRFAVWRTFSWMKSLISDHWVH